MYHYADAIEALADLLGDDPVLTHAGRHRSWRDFEDARGATGPGVRRRRASSPAPRSACCSTTAPSTTRRSSRRSRCAWCRSTSTTATSAPSSPTCSTTPTARRSSTTARSRASCDEVLPGAPLVKLAVEVDDGEARLGRGRAHYEALLAASRAGAAHRAAAGRLPPDVHRRHHRHAEGRDLRGHALDHRPHRDVREERPRPRPAADGARRSCSAR